MKHRLYNKAGVFAFIDSPTPKKIYCKPATHSNEKYNHFYYCSSNAVCPFSFYQPQSQNS